MKNEKPEDKIRVRRIPKRGIYDKETIFRILDNNYICHVGFQFDGYPVVIPTSYARNGDHIYLHGSMASRMLKNLAEGLDVSVAVTKVNAIIISKSGFHSSMNYESVVLFGKAELIEDYDEKLHSMDVFVDHIIPGRSKEVRPHKSGEIKGTMMLKLKIDQATAKVRDEGVNEDEEDLDLDIWNGVVPVYRVYGKAEAQESGRDKPPSIDALEAKSEFKIS